MNKLRQVLNSLVYLLISIFLVFSYSFFIPSLGHLQEFGFKEGVLNLDLVSPWGMAISAVLFALFHQIRRGVNPTTLLNEGIRPLLYFFAMWSERVFYIVRDRANLLILWPFFLSAIWILLFLRVTEALSLEVHAPKKVEGGFPGAGWGPLFFWMAVFFSFSIQLTLNGYGTWGAVQAFAFLGLSYLEFWELHSGGFLSHPTAKALQWIYRVSALVLFILFLSRYLRSL